MKRDTLSEPQVLLSATTTQRPSAAVEAPGYPDDLMQAGGGREEGVGAQGQSSGCFN